MSISTSYLSRGMMPVLGHEEYSCWSFIAGGEQKGQYSNIVCVAGVEDEGKTLQIAPFNWESIDLLRKAEGIVKGKLLATVEGTVGNVRLVASERVISMISQEDVKAKKIKVVINGKTDVLGTVVIADSIDDSKYDLLAGEFGKYGVEAFRRAKQSSSH